MFYVYVLRCRDGSLYTGYTNDLKKRIMLHNEGKASRYTRSRRPVVLVKSWTFGTKQEAMKMEASFKKMLRSSKLKLIGEEHR